MRMKKITNWLFNEPFAFLTSDVLASRITWTIRLRWVAVVGYLSATIAVKNLTDFSLPYNEMWIILVALAVINFIYSISEKWMKRLSFSEELSVLQIQIVIDLIILTLLLHYAGGIGNPIYLFYLFHVVLSSIVFPGFIPLVYATFVVLSFITLLFLEYNSYIGHYCLFPVCNHENIDYIYLVVVVFVVTVYVTTYICMTFMRTYRKIKQEIDRKNRALIESDKQKAKFFRFASHELKSPIIAIKSSLDSFIRNFAAGVDERGVNLVRRADARSSQMLDITQELLELSKDRVLIRKRKVEKNNIPLLLEDIIKQELITAKVKNQELDWQIEKNIPLLTAEKNDLIKIFRNLINNAIRYTPENGKIKILLLMENGRILFSVEDNGIGISEEDRSKIFGEFYRSENAKKMVNFGTGLGLSLVKQLVETYNGTIEVSSQINKGTKFTVTIPIKTGKGAI
jgi:signal transduction histidine kinase